MSKIPYENLNFSSSDSEEDNLTVIEELEMEDEEFEAVQNSGKLIGKSNEENKNIDSKTEVENSATNKVLETRSIDSISSSQKSENRMNLFCVASTSKQPVVNTAEAQIIWPPFLTSGNNVQNNDDRTVTFSNFYEVQRDRSIQCRSREFYPVQRRYRPSAQYSRIRDKDKNLSIRTLRLKLSNVLRKQAEIGNANTQLSREMERMYEEFKNYQQEVNEQQRILTQQISELKEKNISEIQKQYLNLRREMHFKIRVLQQQVDKKIEVINDKKESAVVENYNLLNEIKTLKDENKNLHNALNSERQKLKRSRQLQIHRDDLQASLEERSSRSKNRQQNVNKNFIKLNKKAKFIIPLPDKEYSFFETSGQGSSNSLRDNNTINELDSLKLKYNGEVNSQNNLLNNKNYFKMPKFSNRIIINENKIQGKSSSVSFEEVSWLTDENEVGTNSEEIKKNISINQANSEKRNEITSNSTDLSLWFHRKMATDIFNEVAEGNASNKEIENNNRANDMSSKPLLNETTLWISEEGNPLSNISSRQSPSIIIQETADSIYQQQDQNLSNDNAEEIKNSESPILIRQFQNECVNTRRRIENFFQRLNQNREYLCHLTFCFSFVIITCILLGTLIPVPWRVA
ncbi:putative uncharacterized protein DDB_G0286901 [Centruroides sculpturatus]|uniref:putative uncharacterized protein DDB_G0286901 n=1 Tax=Centruroides sculpturatus TaxID=218467 RepID=UPI000C6D067A|nr:putative uncharacterized protein DDB_G0286901 [Centruroides sculpturatus]